MAQTGYTPIQLYYSTTTSAAPTAGNLANGEIAINIKDGKLFYKDDGGVVQTLATKAATSGSYKQLDITAQGQLRLQDAAGGEYVAHRAPATLAASYTLTWPDDDGTADQVLTTDGNGVLSWTRPAGQVYPSAGIATSTGSAWGTPITDSAGLRGAISDETGTGALVFGTDPSLTRPIVTGTPATTAGARGYDATANVPTYYNGTAVQQVGYLNIPQNSQSAAYGLVLSDSGKHILHPSADTTPRTFTIPANSSVAFPIGTAITFVNQNGAGTVTIAITTDTMRLAGAGTTGNRTLAANGVATAIKIASTEWIISGANLT